MEREALSFVINNYCKDISEIGQAQNGREAIAKAASFKPDIVFMDIKMPGINGIEAASSIKLLYPRCKIVILTAFDYFDYAQEAIKIGVEAFIIKPAMNEQVIEVINTILDKLKQEEMSVAREEEVKNKLELVTNYLETELVSSLYSGDINESQIKEYLSVLELEFVNGFCAIIRVDYDLQGVKISSALQKNMMKKRCMEKIKVSVSNSGLNCIIGHSVDTIYMVVMATSKTEVKKFSKEESIKLMETVQKSIYEQLGISISIAIGSLAEKVSDIGYSFFKAKSVARFTDRDYAIIHYRDVEESCDMVGYPSQKEKELCDKIIICDAESSAIIADELLDWIFQHYQSINEIVAKVYELIIIINRTIMSDLKLGSVTKVDLNNDLKSLTNIREIKNFFKGVVKKLIETIESESHDKTNIQIEKVCEYINKNYRNEISLEDMAKLACMSSYYFSKMFKQNVKVNFIDYLTKVRVKRAKEYLMDPKVNIKDISELVGYTDPNYFTRVFKRIEGMTPSEYRGKKML